MLPRGLTGRIVLAFVGLAAAMLSPSPGRCSSSCISLNQDEQALGNQVVWLVDAVAPRGGRPGTIEQTSHDGRARSSTTAATSWSRTPTGAIRVLVGNPSSDEMPPAPTGSSKVQSTRRGPRTASLHLRRAQPAATSRAGASLRRPGQVGPAGPGRPARSAARSSSLVLFVVGMPIAWLLSRSLTGPMRRLAKAARDLPQPGPIEKPLPLEGPTEVRVLTERFNAMAHELASTRQRGDALLANLRHDLRTPLTSIARLRRGDRRWDGLGRSRGRGGPDDRRGSAAARAAGRRAGRGRAAARRTGRTPARGAGSQCPAGRRRGAVREPGRRPGRVLEVAGAHPGRSRPGLHRRSAGRRADPPEPRRQRPLGAAEGRPHLAARGVAAHARPTGRSRHQRHRRRPGLSAREPWSASSNASIEPIHREPGAAPAWAWRSSASWPEPTAAKPGRRTSPRTAPG